MFVQRTGQASLIQNELVDKLFKLLNIVVDVLFELLIDNIEFVAFCVKLALSPMNKQRELSLLRPNNNATASVEV